MKQCISAKKNWKEKNAVRIAKDDNLLGIGVGLKESKGVVTDKLAVKYYVRQKKEKIGAAEKIPGKVGDSPTDVVQMAPLIARAPFTRRLRPAMGGCSGCVEVEGLTYTGTLGLGVRGFGSLSHLAFIVSNNHVLADENRSRRGDPVIQPGRLDGGDPQTDVIGELFDFVPLRFTNDPNAPNPPVNKVDAACALVHTFGDFTREIFWVGYPKGWRSRQSIEQDVQNGNTKVQKCGRTTGYTQGVISSVSFDGFVRYDTGFAFFEDQMLIEPGSFSDAGDSGSGILDMNENIAGLLFAGGPTHTIANFIEDVWQQLAPIDFSDGIV